jgi:beta-exotoxin I transport system permease protein
VLRDVLGKTLFDQRRSLLGWSLALVLLVAMYVAIWPSVRDQPSMSDFLDQMPEAFRSLFAATGADMSTGAGYLQVELLSFMGPIIVLIYAVGSGSSAVAGEEERRTMDTLLANPVSRTRVVLHKAAAMVLGTALLGAVLAAALVLEGRLADMGLSTGNVVAAMLHLTLLGVVFGSLALAVSAATGSLALSRTVPVVVAVVAYLVNGLAPMVDWLRPLQKGSPFFQYAGHDPLHHGLDAASLAVAVATTVVLVAAAVWGFRRRDVHG